MRLLCSGVAVSRKDLVLSPLQCEVSWSKPTNPPTKELTEGGHLSKSASRCPSVCVATPALTASLGSETDTLNCNWDGAYVQYFPSQLKTPTRAHWGISRSEMLVALYTQVNGTWSLLSQRAVWVKLLLTPTVRPNKPSGLLQMSMSSERCPYVSDASLTMASWIAVTYALRVVQKPVIAIHGTRSLSSSRNQKLGL